MKYFLIFITLIFLCGSEALALRYDLAPEKRYFFTYDVLPDWTSGSASSAFSLGFPAGERSGIELEYLSFDSPFLTGSSYLLTYQMTYGLKKLGIIYPTLSGGWRFIFTPETGFVTPLNFGLISEIEIEKDLYVRIPLTATIFSKEKIFDLSITVVKKATVLGDLTIGYRGIGPYVDGDFENHTMFLIGFKNEL